MITTNTGAKKMESTDEWRQIVATSGGAHNDTVDAYDHCIGALQNSLGIVVDGKQAAVSATTGQYVILKNSSIVDSGDVMLADGLYTAAKAISANTDIDKTYLTAVSGGGLNSLNGNIATLLERLPVYINNTGGGTLAPSQYGLGITVEEGGANASYGTITTMKYNNTRCTQIAMSYKGDIKTRGAASASTWEVWKTY